MLHKREMLILQPNHWLDSAGHRCWRLLPSTAETRGEPYTRFAIRKLYMCCTRFRRNPNEASHRRRETLTLFASVWMKPRVSID